MIKRIDVGELLIKYVFNWKPQGLSCEQQGYILLLFLQSRIRLIEYISVLLAHNLGFSLVGGLPEGLDSKAFTKLLLLKVFAMIRKF